MLLLFRLGNQYLAFDEDAPVIASLLGLPTPSPRGFASFRHEILEAILRRLLDDGHRVAILDRVE